MEAHVLRRITNRLPNEPINTSLWDHFDGLQLADPNYNIPGEIDVLLGAQVCSEILCAEIRRGKRGQPIAQKTSLGWIVFGSMDHPQRLAMTLHAANKSEAELDTAGSAPDIGGERLDELLQRFLVNRRHSRVPFRHKGRRIV